MFNAFKHGSVDVVSQLLAMGAKLQSVNKRNESALYEASRGQHMDCVTFLQTKGLEFVHEVSNDQIKFYNVAGCVFPQVKLATKPKIVDHLCNQRFSGKLRNLKKKKKGEISRAVFVYFRFFFSNWANVT